MLVSIAVITYNSSEFIVELLESIKNQTYQEIELVISDDASKDNTMKIVSAWIEQNQFRFVKAMIVESSVNTGLTRNANRAFRACNGEWVKLIAGDDVLELNAIEVFAKTAAASNAAVIFSGISHFSKEQGVFRVYPTLVEKERFFRTESGLFSTLVKKGNFLPAPGAFHNREIFLKQGRFDERIPMMEDFPYWLKCLQNGYLLKFSIIDFPLIKYRIHENAVSHSSNQLYANRRVMALELLLIKYYILPLSKYNILWYNGFNLKIIAYNLWQSNRIPQFIPRFIFGIGCKLTVDFVQPFEINTLNNP